MPILFLNDAAAAALGEALARRLAVRALMLTEPRRVCWRLQLLRGWSDDGEEDGGEPLA